MPESGRRAKPVELSTLVGYYATLARGRKPLMARLPYTSPEPEGEIAQRIAQRRGGELRPLDRMLLHSPPIADGWNSLLAAIRGKSTLPADIRELIILRVAALNGAAYEWAAHEPVARRAGLRDAHLEAVRVGDPGPLSAARRAVLAYTDAMTREVCVPDVVFAGLRRHFDDRGVVEVTATIGTYNLVSRFLVALDISAGTVDDG